MRLVFSLGSKEDAATPALSSVIQVEAQAYRRPKDERVWLVPTVFKLVPF